MGFFFYVKKTNVGRWKESVKKRIGKEKGWPTYSLILMIPVLSMVVLCLLLFVSVCVSLRNEMEYRWICFVEKCLLQG